MPPCRSNEIYLQATAATDIQRPFVPCRNRLLADSVDTIQIEVWSTIYPARNITPRQAWQKLEAPDTRLWEATKVYGVPMNVTFLNATSYKVGNTQPCRALLLLPPLRQLLTTYPASARDSYLSTLKGIPHPFTRLHIILRLPVCAEDQSVDVCLCILHPSCACWQHRRVSGSQ